MLEVKNVTGGYGQTTVLREVSLEVPDGKVVTLLGPNGAGKTTLLRVVSGLLKPSSGEIFFAGQEVTGRRAYQMARLGLCHLPEGRGIFPSLSVRENLILQSPKGEEDQCIQQAVEAFPPLAPRLKQMAGSLSGGEQQMLALVRTFVTNPKLVVVDEPSQGLAPLIVDRIFDTLRHIAAQGTSLLIVEQYISRALDLADTAYLMNRGQVVPGGPAKDLSAAEVYERYLGIEVAAES